MSRLKRDYEERLELMRSEDRQQKDQIARLRVAVDESRKSEEEARLRSRRWFLICVMQKRRGKYANANIYSAEEVGKLTEREHFSAELKRTKDNCEREKADLKRLHQLEMEELHARLHASEKLTRAIDTVEQTAQRVNELSRSVSSQRQGSLESVDAAMKARERAILQSEEKISRDMQFIEAERARIEELATHVRELTAETRRHASEDKSRSSRDSSRLDSLVASLEAVNCPRVTTAAVAADNKNVTGKRCHERSRHERDAASRRNTRPVLPPARVCSRRRGCRAQGASHCMLDFGT
jgi:DNA repair exonuclease SbcCD ATPase subunit